MIQRAATGPIDELAGVIVDLRSRVQTLEVIAHRHLFNLDPTTWVAPALLNGWANAGAPFQAAQYRRVGDIVSLRGVFGAGAIGLAAFNLPAGFLPPADLTFACSAGGAFGSLTVTAAGAVIPAVGAAAGFSMVAAFSVTA